ncbi:hypothetical protein K491DRAFT_318778 [Lophiostoma macrostomum CBS 122681]|uniref:Uncharacterized protein n=1 Tax=Lophiostoma macrostomum CBS 122681 TaxID=1314788 RepID=A0A6A6TEA3_9PLEO|nr:hypothetical protein K491DRAFT_318778 [Lophiostoma macrostomum CBS 122681]
MPQVMEYGRTSHSYVTFLDLLMHPGVLAVRTSCSACVRLWLMVNTLDSVPLHRPAGKSAAALMAAAMGLDCTDLCYWRPLSCLYPQLPSVVSLEKRKWDRCSLSGRTFSTRASIGRSINWGGHVSIHGDRSSIACLEVGMVLILVFYLSPFHSIVSSPDRSIQGFDLPAEASLNVTRFIDGL